MTDEKEPLDQFRAYYTRERAAGSEEEAMRLSAEETGLYSMLRRAFYAGYRARGEVPAPPVPVHPAVLEALEVLRGHFDGQQQPETPSKAVAAGLGGGKDSLDHLVEAAAPLVELPVAPAGPPPVAYLADYTTDGPPHGSKCPTCQSGDPDTRLPVWNDSFGEHVGCPDGWHPGNFTVMGAVTGRIRRVASGLIQKQAD